jgi:glycosyltransferase involved in cell wall biosynthesis
MHVVAPGPAGGAEQVVLDLTAALVAEGVEVHVVPVLDADVPEHPFLKALAGEVIVHPLLLPPRAYRREQNALASLIRRNQPVVVHTHGYRADVVGSFAVRREGVPWVATVHGVTRGGWRNDFYQWLQRWSLRRADAVVAVARDLAVRMQAAGIRWDRLYTIPNAYVVRAETFLNRAEACAELGLRPPSAPPGVIRIGWLGRLSPDKGPDVLMEALGRLQDQPWTCTFIGDGPLAGALAERAAELSIQDRLHWTGLLSGAARVLPAFDVLVISSRTEGTPIVLLEALSAGVPVIATRVGGIPEIVSANEALLVPPENPEALAAALGAVMENRTEAQARAGRALARLRAGFSAARWAQRYLEVYHAAARHRLRST